MKKQLVILLGIALLVTVSYGHAAEEQERERAQALKREAIAQRRETMKAIKSARLAAQEKKSTVMQKWPQQREVKAADMVEKSKMNRESKIGRRRETAIAKKAKREAEIRRNAMAISAMKVQKKAGPKKKDSRIIKRNSQEKRIVELGTDVRKVSIKDTKRADALMAQGDALYNQGKYKAAVQKYVNTRQFIEGL